MDVEPTSQPQSRGTKELKAYLAFCALVGLLGTAGIIAGELGPSDLIGLVSIAAGGGTAFKALRVSDKSLSNRGYVLREDVRTYETKGGPDESSD